MKFFQRKSAPAEARPPLSRYGAGAVVGDWPRSYDAQVRAGFVDNAIAQRSVKLVAESVADAPLIASSPDLAALAAPRLREAVAVQLLLHGMRWRRWTWWSSQRSRRPVATRRLAHPNRANRGFWATRPPAHG